MSSTGIPSRWGFSEKRKTPKIKLRMRRQLKACRGPIASNGWVRSGAIEASMDRLFGKCKRDLSTES